MSVIVEFRSWPPLPARPAISGFGVTRKVKGRQLWAHYLYKTRQAAQQFADSCKTDMEVDVNVSMDRPYCFVDR